VYPIYVNDLSHHPSVSIALVKLGVRPALLRIPVRSFQLGLPIKNVSLSRTACKVPNYKMEATCVRGVDGQMWLQEVRARLDQRKGRALK